MWPRHRPELVTGMPSEATIEALTNPPGGDGGEEPTASPTHPIVVFLPGTRLSLANSSSRIADLLALTMTRGAGTFHTEDCPPPTPGATALTDRRRIVSADGVPVLDVCSLDYRATVSAPAAGDGGLSAALKGFAFALWYFLRALVMVLLAWRRAKGWRAKTQLVVGSSVVVLLLGALVVTVWAALTALGVLEEPVVAGTAADALAIGGAAVTTFLFVKARPVVQAATQVVHFALDYAEDQRFADGIAEQLRGAVDEVVESDRHRPVHLLGYSFGALVAYDFLCPRRTSHPAVDDRLPGSVASLITIGCPIDFLRLYVPKYLEGRQARVPELPWTNVYIPADVFGSDFSTKRTITGKPGKLDLGMRPTSLQYTDQELTLRSMLVGRGFLSHGCYWSGPERGNCLDIIARAVVPAHLVAQRPDYELVS